VRSGFEGLRLAPLVKRADEDVKAPAKKARKTAETPLKS
jgi:hypothetical protein